MIGKVKKKQGGTEGADIKNARIGSFYAKSGTVEKNNFFQWNKNKVELSIDTIDGLVKTNCYQDMQGEVYYFNDPIMSPDYTVTKPSGTYQFKLNSNGYYESNNKGVKSSYALAKVTFDAPQATTITVNYISYGESNYDYGIFSELNKTLTASFTADTSNVKKSCKGESSSSVKTLTYNIPEGTSFFYAKYIKDSSTDSKNDSLQFKIVI